MRIACARRLIPLASSFNTKYTTAPSQIIPYQWPQASLRDARDLPAISLRKCRSACNLIGKTLSDCKAQSQLVGVLTQQAGLAWPLCRALETR